MHFVYLRIQQLQKRPLLTVRKGTLSTRGILLVNYTVLSEPPSRFRP